MDLENLLQDAADGRTFTYSDQVAVSRHDFGNENRNQAAHMLVHFITDQDIRQKDPEVDRSMRADMLRLLDELRQKGDKTND